MQANRRPNLLFVFADQWHAQAAGYAGDPNVATPNLDRFAATSLNFANAVSASYNYYHGLKGLIASWRQVWGRADMPFYVVQLPGFIEHRNQQKHALDMDSKSVAEAGGLNEQHSWPYTREAQLRVAEEDPNVELIVTIDLGDKFDIHPRRKLSVGERLALKARKHVYGEKELVADAPAPTAYKEEKIGYRITFDGVGTGLVAKDALAGFELQTKDGNWQAAQAAIDGKEVVVTGDAGQTYTGVRYGWRGFPEVTLTNSAGLPATPFIFPRPELKGGR